MYVNLQIEYDYGLTAALLVVLKSHRTHKEEMKEVVTSFHILEGIDKHIVKKKPYSGLSRRYELFFLRGGGYQVS